MTIQEIKTEMAYRVQERLGILCGADTPTAAQKRLAEQEANEWRESYELEQWKNRCIAKLRACNPDEQNAKGQ